MLSYQLVIMLTSHHEDKIKEKVEMAQFAQSDSIHAASKHYAVDRNRICEWIQNLKAGNFTGVSSTTARLPGGGRHVINEEDDDEEYWESDDSNATDQD